MIKNWSHLGSWAVIYIYFFVFNNLYHSFEENLTKAPESNISCLLVGKIKHILSTWKLSALLLFLIIHKQIKSAYRRWALFFIRMTFFLFFFKSFIFLSFFFIWRVNTCSLQVSRDCQVGVGFDSCGLITASSSAKKILHF